MRFKAQTKGRRERKRKGKEEEEKERGKESGEGKLEVKLWPVLLGSRVRFPAGAFAIFSVSAKASLPISLPHFPFLFLSLPLPFLSSSFPFDLSFAR